MNQINQKVVMTINQKVTIRRVAGTVSGQQWFKKRIFQNKKHYKSCLIYIIFVCNF